MPRKKIIKYLLEVTIPIFEENVDIVITNNIISSWKKYDLTEEPTESVEGVTIIGEEKYAILLKIPISLNTIVHEVRHFIDDLLKERGMDLNEESASETAAYLSGWLVGEIEKFKNSIKDKI